MTAGARTVAVVGATGVVGSEILDVLAQRELPCAELRAVASAEHAGERVAFGERQLRVEALGDEVLAGVDLAFLAAGSEVSARYARQLEADGATVIDTSDHFVGDLDVPVLVPEVHGWQLGSSGAVRLVTVAPTALAAVAAVLKPLDDEARLRTVNIATYEPVSGAGRSGVDELGGQTTALLNGQSVAAEVFAHQIAFNCIPTIGELDGDGHSAAERVLSIGLRRVLDRPDLRVAATRVLVAVFFGLGAAVTVELDRALDPDAARGLLRGAPGLLVGDADDYTTLIDAIGTDAVHVGRVRGEPEWPTSLRFWIVVDNARKTAVNAVTIADALLR